MVDVRTREFLGTLATRGWRNFLAWGGSTVLLLLGLAFVWRFFVGSLSSQDFIALVGIVGPLLFQQWTRHVEIRAGVANTPSIPSLAQGPGAAAGFA